MNQKYVLFFLFFSLIFISCNNTISCESSTTTTSSTTSTTSITTTSSTTTTTTTTIPFYNVSFDANGGEGTMESVRIDKNNPYLPENTFTKDNCDFCGWASNLEGTIDYNQDRARFKSTSRVPDVTLYAIWASKGLSYLSQDDICYVSNKTFDGENLIIPEYNSKGDKVIGIAENGFSNLTNLKTIKIGNNVEVLGAYAFNGCENLETVNIPDSVQTIEEYVFNKCSKFKSIEINKSYWSCNDDKYNYYGPITALTINNLYTMPNKIWHKLDPKMIYRHISFHGNGGTGTMADFDATVDSILPTNQFTHDSLIFYGWSTNTDATGNFYEDKAHLSEITQETTLHLYAIWGSSGLYFITDTTTCYVMESPSGFNAANLIIPPYNKTGKKVTSIQTDGFDENTNIQKVKIPYSIHTIGDNAFENCTNIKEVELANGVKTILEETFQGCENLESITIPDSVTLIGKNTFKGCNKLTNINITQNTYWTYNNENNSILGCPIEMTKENLKNKVQYYWHQVDKNQELYTITLNENDDEIKTHPRNSSYLFQMTPLNAKLPKIMFTQAPPEWDFCGWSTTKDGSGNYFKDEGILETDSQDKNITLYAIWGIKGLQYSSGDTTCDIVGFTPSTTTQFLVIPYYNQYGQKVTGIGENVFKGWAQNTSTILKMPSSITTLGKAAFMNTNITKVSSWSDEITEIPESLFEGSSLLTVRIPDEVTTIGNRAFYNSLNLSGTMLDFVIPKNVTSIGESAFNSTIPSVKIEATTPPTLGSNNFQNVEKIYVPTGSLSLYQAADGWKDLPLYEK